MEELIDKTTDEKLIEDAFQDLLDGYLRSNHRKKIDIIKRAYTFARDAHKGVRRRSGEPYILHPIEVARIVSQEIGLGSTSICAALLHDVVEDTDYTVEDIENLFGSRGTYQNIGWYSSRPYIVANRELQEIVAHDVGRYSCHYHQDSRPPAQHAHPRLTCSRQAI